MNYDGVMDYLEDLKGLGIVPGLDSVKELCKRLGNPQDDLKFVHISGTNGKGSTLAYISTILKTAGYRVGRYISPTIFDYRERIQVNNQYITKKALCHYMEEIKNICDQMVQDGFNHPTAFEIETAIGFLYFKEKACDIVVLETGMGGKEDATNVIKTTQVAVIASVSMDHMGFLGKKLTDIADHKAGIIKKDCLTVTSNTNEAVINVIENKCQEENSKLSVTDLDAVKKLKTTFNKTKFDYKDLKNIEISLPGKCQVDNSILAIEAVWALRKKGFEIEDKAILKGLKDTVWQGRFSKIADRPLFVIDGAHNVDAAMRLKESIELYFTNKKIVYIMGMLKDKEYEKVVELTAEYAQQIITITPPNNPRALPAYELAKEVMKYNGNVTAVDSIEEAVELAYIFAAKEDVILSFGSLSYLGHMIEVVSNRKPERHR